MFWVYFAIPFVLVLAYAVYHDYKGKSYSECRHTDDNENYASAQSMADINRYSNSGGGGGY
jgi:hypothetical protein